MNNPIFSAIEENDIESVREMLVSDPQSANSVNDAQQTPLHRAAAGGNTEIIQLLLEKGAMINATDSVGWTPLHVACYHQRIPAMETLIHDGCEINARNMDGWTPLQLALSHGLYREAKLLRNKGGDVH